jgi:hypothetical protein
LTVVKPFDLTLSSPVSGVRYVRFTPLTPMAGGSAYLDLSEFTVYGRTLPKTTILSGPTTLDSDPTPTFTFSSDQANATFACSLVRDEMGGPPPPPAGKCTSPYTPQTPLTNGDYYLEVTAISASGAFDQPTRREWTLNTSLPDTTITAGPGAFTNDPRPAFTVAGPNPTCTWDGVAGPCTRTTALADGPHTFSAAANNANGADPTPATRAFTVDTAAPAVSFLGELTGADAVSYAFAATDATRVTFTCRFDGVSAPCRSTKTYSGLANGTHTWVLTATDAAGNSASLPPRTFGVSVTDYDTRLDSAPAGLITQADVQFEFSSPNGGSAFECSLDGEEFAACTSPRDENGLGEGPHTFDVRAVGPGSRRDATPAHAELIVDTTPPDTILDPVAGAITYGVATIGFHATEPATFLCSVDGAPEFVCTSPLTLTALGRHTVAVSAVDFAGNIDPDPARVDVEVQAPPAATPSPSPSPSPTPTATPKRALEKVTVARTVSLKSLRKAGKLRFTVRAPKGARVTATAKLGRKTLGKAKRTATGTLTLKVSKSKLKKARKGAKITLRVSASGSGLVTTTHTARIKLRN